MVQQRHCYAGCATSSQRGAETQLLPLMRGNAAMLIRDKISRAMYAAVTSQTPQTGFCVVRSTLTIRRVVGACSLVSRQRLQQSVNTAQQNTTKRTKLLEVEVPNIQEAPIYDALPRRETNGLEDTTSR